MSTETEVLALQRDINRYECLRRACKDDWMRKVLDDTITLAKQRLRKLDPIHNETATLMPPSADPRRRA